MRMGADKATMVVDGKPMAVRVADALWEAGCHPVECQGGDAAALAEYGLDAHPDSEPFGGPASAILDALERHTDVALVIAACDLAELDGATVGKLLDAATRVDDVDVVVATTGGRRHLVGWWRRGAAARLAPIVRGGERSYLGVLDGLRTLEVEVSDRALRNVNTPADVDDGDSLGAQ